MELTSHTEVGAGSSHAEPDLQPISGSGLNNSSVDQTYDEFVACHEDGEDESIASSTPSLADCASVSARESLVVTPAYSRAVSGTADQFGLGFDLLEHSHRIEGVVDRAFFIENISRKGTPGLEAALTTQESQPPRDDHKLAEDTEDEVQPNPEPFYGGWLEYKCEPVHSDDVELEEPMGAEESSEEHTSKSEELLEGWLEYHVEQCVDDDVVSLNDLEATTEPEFFPEDMAGRTNAFLDDKKYSFHSSFALEQAARERSSRRVSISYDDGYTSPAAGSVVEEAEESYLEESTELTIPDDPLTSTAKPRPMAPSTTRPHSTHLDELSQPSKYMHMLATSYFPATDLWSQTRPEYDLDDYDPVCEDEDEDEDEDENDQDNVNQDEAEPRAHDESDKSMAPPPRPSVQAPREEPRVSRPSTPLPFLRPLLHRRQLSTPTAGLLGLHDDASAHLPGFRRMPGPGPARPRPESFCLERDFTHLRRGSFHGSHDAARRPPPLPALRFQCDAFAGPAWRRREGEGERGAAGRVPSALILAAGAMMASQMMQRGAGTGT